MTALALKVVAVQREFRYGSRTLVDPSPELSVDKVREFYANIHPELLNATVSGGAFEGEVQVFTFERSIGTKG